MTLPVPAPAPAVTTPEDPLIVRSPVALHTPPLVASVKVSAVPAQKFAAPFIGVVVFTVTIVVVAQPALETKAIVAVPIARPLTIPLDEPTVAMAVLLLLHVPVPAVNVKVVPVHILLVFPAITGTAATLTIVVATHPVLTTQVIVAEPALIPVMSAPELWATAVLLLDQEIIPDDASLSIVVPPTHMVVTPSIGDGFAKIVFDIKA